MKNKITKLLLIVLTFVTLNMSVKAEDKTNMIDFSKTGSIDIVLEDKDNEKVSSLSLAIYYIASLEDNNHKVSFAYTPSFNTCNTSLEELDEEELLNELEQIIDEKDPLIVKETDEEGKVSFTNLNLGIYLVKQTTKKEGYSKISSFLVTLPTYNSNTWDYNIKSTPKTEIYKVIDITILKKWNTSSNNLPKEVIIGLYKDKELIDKVTLNKENNWEYTFTDIEKSDDYYVKEIKVPSGYIDTYRKIDNNTFIVTNTKSLARTGNQVWLINLFAVSGVLLIVLGIVVEKKKYE